MITVTHQRHELLARKAASLRAQTLAPRLFEWCVASNGDLRAAAWLNDQQTPFALKPVMLAPAQPIAAARNAAVERASGDLLLMSDDDVLLPPGCLAAHLEAHGYDPDTGTKVAPAADSWPRVVIGDLRLPARLRTSAEREPFERAASVAGRALWINATGANTSLTRAAFAEVGGYDPAFAGYGGEDSDLALRLRGIGARFVRSHAAWAEHVGLVSGDVEKATAAGRAGVRVWRKHGGLGVGLMLGVHPALLACKRALLATPLKALFGRRTAAYEEAYLRGAAEELAQPRTLSGRPSEQERR